MIKSLKNKALLIASIGAIVSSSSALASNCVQQTTYVPIAWEQITTYKAHCQYSIFETYRDGNFDEWVKQGSSKHSGNWVEFKQSCPARGPAEVEHTNLRTHRVIWRTQMIPYQKVSYDTKQVNGDPIKWRESTIWVDSRTGNRCIPE
ncbi:hypothetical protein N480_14105 [Pseudoalteromonas luteoviolacea S2607]|uniref:hypothetical protein n=1 Tax=Pseudoalteromonas luteoviolacea TaxID=43657 RepID=UPI0007B09439|nr:hypothetical protein [Pseudoalteromonas luteoviolacea]KZN37872.1 hypothetical protein N480_14105 [Pseudoalteromonas luteoviolacea S2607]